MWSDVRAIISLTRREYQLACRAASFWSVAGVGSAVAIWRSSYPGTSAGVAAYQQWQMTVLGVGVIAILFAASAAARDGRRAADELVLAKPYGSLPPLVMARFLGSMLSLLTLAAIMLGAAAAAQGALAGTAFRLWPYVAGLLWSVFPLAVAAALGFSLTTAFRTQLASGSAAVYWVAVSLARPHTPMALDMTLSRHWPQCALLAGALVALAAWLHGRRLRHDMRPGRMMATAFCVLLAGTVLAVIGSYRSGEDALVNADPVLGAIASQTVDGNGLAPGFWLRDSGGELVGLSDFEDSVVVLAFWGPASPESAEILPLLNTLADRHAGSSLAVLAICEDRDAATIGPFRGELSESVILLHDRGRHFGDGLDWSDAPVVVAYGITGVPTTIVLDRERRIAHTLGGMHTQAKLDRAVSRLLEGG
jgi:peroxiredoxin